MGDSLFQIFSDDIVKQTVKNVRQPLMNNGK